MWELMARLCYDWGVRCFGKAHMQYTPIRALRLLEEAVELAQSLRVPKEQMHKLVDVVCERPSGIPFQELGGVFVTASVLCLALGYESPSIVFERELQRCLSKDPNHFSVRNKEKMDLGLTGNET